MSSQGEIRCGIDSIYETSITDWEQKQIPKLALSFLPPAPDGYSFSLRLLQLIKVMDTLDIPPLLEEFGFGQNNC
jgi:hypothetical protein